MTSTVNHQAVFVVLTVILLILLAVVMLVLIDHKSKIPGHFKSDPFSISGIRNEHPVIAFVISSFLGVIILGLLFEMAVVMGTHFGLINDTAEKSELLDEIRQARKQENVRHFHNISPNSEKINQGKKAICFQCHGDYPHSKTRMVRSILNMHTQFIGCMTCHMDPRQLSEDNYHFDWLNFSGFNVKGKPFGLGYDPKSGYLSETDDLYSKIVIYDENISTEESLLEITEENKEASQFINATDTLSDIDRHAIKIRFHKNVMNKGRFCTRCHTDETSSYIPFRVLGFSDRRIQDLTNVNIVGLVEKYRTFYLPSLSNTDTSLPPPENLVGDQNKTTPVPREELSKGRAWWRNEK